MRMQHRLSIVFGTAAITAALFFLVQSFRMTDSEVFLRQLMGQEVVYARRPGAVFWIGGGFNLDYPYSCICAEPELTQFHDGELPPSPPSWSNVPCRDGRGSLIGNRPMCDPNRQIPDLVRVAGENSKTEPAKIHQSAYEITMLRKILDAGKQCIDTTTINGTSCSDLIPVAGDLFISTPQATNLTLNSPSTPINSLDLNRFIRNGEKFRWAEDSDSLLDTTGSSSNVWGEVAVIKHKKKGLLNRRLDRRRKAALSREDFHNTILDIFGENKPQSAEEEIKRNTLGLRMLQFIQNAVTKQKSTLPAEQPVDCQQLLGISTPNERWVYINISVSDSQSKKCPDSDTAESRTMGSDAADDESKEVDEEEPTRVTTQEAESPSPESLPTQNDTLMKWLAAKQNVIESLSTDSCGTMKTKLFNFGYGSSQIPKSQSAIMRVVSPLSPSECGLPMFKEYLSATSDMKAKTFLRKDDLVALGFAAISGVGVKSRIALAIAGAVTVRRPQDDRGLEWVRQYLQNTGKTSNRKTLEDLLVLGQPQLTRCPVDIYGLWELMSLVPKPDEGEAATCYFAFHGSHIFLFAAHDLARGTRLTSSS